jgi:hypothetical protein
MEPAPRVCTVHKEEYPNIPPVKETKMLTNMKTVLALGIFSMMMEGSPLTSMVTARIGSENRFANITSECFDTVHVFMMRCKRSACPEVETTLIPPHTYPTVEY